MPRLGFHQVMGLLGTGDLHPGGQEATETLLTWLRPRVGGSVLEIGAGIGNTSRRLARDGWQVTALEPDPVLFEQLRTVPGIEALNRGLSDHSGKYDTVIAESVLYALVPQAFVEIRRLLNPGGLLVFNDMVWTDRAHAESARAAHHETRERFGLPVASASPYTWSDWKKMLSDAGFVLLQEKRLGPGSPGTHTRLSRIEQVLRVSARPSLLFDYLRLKATRSRVTLESGALESWLCCAEVTQPDIS